MNQDDQKNQRFLPKKEMTYEEYKSHVVERLNRLVPMFAKSSVGDFSLDVNFPEEEDEFTEFYSGIQIMLDVIREKIASLEAEIEEHKKTEEALRRSEAELKQLDLMKTEFISLAAHQLRTPLSTMRWNIELLTVGKTVEGLPPSIKEKLHSIYASSRRLVTLVNTLLDISRIEQGIIPNTPQNTNVMEVVKGVIEEAQAMAQNMNVTLELKAHHGDLGAIFVDPQRFQEVLSNLISNAIKFNSAGGRVDIIIERKEDILHIEVSDTGIGIAAEEAEKIFGKFYRTTAAKNIDPQGVGLGLFMVKSYIETWGGRIWFKSPTQGTLGTTFFVEIPIKKT